jgi:hypothetical protein
LRRSAASDDTPFLLVETQCFQEEKDKILILTAMPHRYRYLLSERISRSDSKIGDDMIIDGKDITPGLIQIELHARKRQNAGHPADEIEEARKVAISMLLDKARDRYPRVLRDPHCEWDKEVIETSNRMKNGMIK